MTRTRSSTIDRWRTYLTEQCDSEVGALAGAYPERRSLTVDVIDVYDYDEELVTALFDDPTHVLRQASDALRELHDDFGRVHVRVENNPELLGVDRLGAPHVHELVTVEGVVASVGDVETTAVKTVYECPNCNGSLVTRPAGVQLDEPHRCERCGWDGGFDLRHDRSTFADLQRVTFAQLPEDRRDGAGDDPRTVPVYLADDLVGSVAPDDQLLVTGVVRLTREGSTNRFDRYVDANAVAEEHRREDSEGLAEIITSQWNHGLG